MFKQVWRNKVDFYDTISVACPGFILTGADKKLGGTEFDSAPGGGAENPINLKYILIEFAIQNLGIIYICILESFNTNISHQLFD